MTAAETPRLRVTVRTRLGQVLEVDMEPAEAAEVHAALTQMVSALFTIERPENVRSVTFDIERS